MKRTGKFATVHVMKVYVGVQVRLHSFLTSALDIGEWSLSHPIILPLSGNTRDTHWIAGWMTPESLDTFG